MKAILSLPRAHYRHIENLTTEKIAEQKTRIVNELATKHGM
jgi:hypothetical protein